MILRDVTWQISATALVCGAFLIGAEARGQTDPGINPTIPRTWDDAAIDTLEVPLANPAGSPKHVSADYYYKIPVRPIYKQYPVYAPGREPPGYTDWLKKQEPVILWDDSGHRPQLATEAEWIKAGQIVFEAYLFADPSEGGIIGLHDVRSSEWYQTNQIPVTRAGVLPFLSYVIREKGKIELGSFSCAMCHTRVLADNTVVEGAQGNFPFNRALAHAPLYGLPTDVARSFNRSLFAAPWLKPDPMDREQSMSPEQSIAVQRAVPPGVQTRHRSSLFFPVQVPDLIGIKDRIYLDRTGLQQQHSIVDLMRYAAMNQGADALASFDGFIPLGGPNFDKRPDPEAPEAGGRYSDEQLYALALYVYSLQPPQNPNKMDAVAVHGQKVFEHAGCPLCHTPPLYTSNKLTPALGFTAPPGASQKYAILPFSVGTDPGLALQTRRGTGYYKVPSLKGVWYRSMFGHSGWCATLEDWFDPSRQKDGYVPTGFKPFDAATYPVKGHPFGLELSEDDRKALISFLKTL